MDRITKGQRRKNMQAIKATGSQIEKMLGKALWAEGLRYRKNDKRVFGKPDFVLVKHKLVIFCDGEFWHGKDWKKKKSAIKSNKKFWHTKIEGNIIRDKVVNKRLKSEGWMVIRFWGEKIMLDPEKCVNLVKERIGT
jgi:DNA mismatch endonuclease (patch repair protein)